MKTVDIDKSKASDGASIRWQNFGVSKLSFSLPCKSPKEPAPYNQDEAVRVLYRGKTVLIGRVSVVRQRLTGSAYSWSVEMLDWWDRLNRVQAVFSPSKLTGPLSVATDSTGKPITVTSYRVNKVYDAINSILKRAKEVGVLPCDYEVRVRTSLTMFDISVDHGTYASLLQRVLGACPGLVAFFDYSGAVPKLIVTEAMNLPAVDLDAFGFKYSAVDLRRRENLVPSCVGVIYGGNYQMYPVGSDPHDPGAEILFISGQYAGHQTSPDDKTPTQTSDWNFTRPQILIQGKELPTGPTSTSCRPFWTSKFPDLAKVSVPLTFGTITKQAKPDETGSANYATSATQNELISGLISEDVKSVKWCNTTVRQACAIQGKVPDGLQAYINKPVVRNGTTLGYWGWLQVDVRTVNVKRKYYRQGGQEGTGEDPLPDDQPTPEEIPNFHAALKTYYDLTRDVPSEGAIEVHGIIDPVALIGAKVNIGLRDEWRNMNAVAQDIAFDLGDGQTSITVGAPEHIALQELINRTIENARQQDTQRDSDERSSNNPTISWQFDPNRKISPEGATVGPWSQIAQPEIDGGNEYGFQVKILRELGSDSPSGITVVPGHIYLNGVFQSAVPVANFGSYFKSSITAGKVYLSVTFNKYGEMDSSSIISSPIVAEALQLSGEYYADETGRTSGRPGKYCYHIATITNGKVTQHVMGHIDIPIHGGTYYPYPNAR